MRRLADNHPPANLALSTFCLLSQEVNPKERATKIHLITLPASKLHLERRLAGVQSQDTSNRAHRDQQRRHTDLRLLPESVPLRDDQDGTILSVKPSLRLKLSASAHMDVSELVSHRAHGDNADHLSLHYFSR